MRPGVKAFNAFASFVMREIFFRIMGGRRIVGRERVPKTGAVLFAANHMSYLDPPLAGTCSGRRMRAMAKEELFHNPFLGWLMRSIGVFPIRRGAGDREAIRRAIEWLEAGDCMLMFPEGTRGPGDGKMLPFQSGVEMLAKRSGCVVVPVGVAGTQRAFPKGGKFRGGRVGVCYGTPMRFEEFGKGEFTAELARRISACTAELGEPQAVTEVDGS